MGFDMQMVSPPKELPPAYVAQYEDQPGYYRFKTSAMVIMAVVMQSAEILSEDPAPQWPPWPPKNVAPERLKLIEEAVRKGEVTPGLTKAEQEIVTSAIEASKKVRAARSKNASQVPAFKFRSNDGWIVASEECRIIATRLRRYAEHIKQDDLDGLAKQYQLSQQKLMQGPISQGEIVISGHEPLGLTLSELKKWVLEWAAFNDLASRNGGYLVQ